MLHETKCIEVFNKIATHRDVYSLDEVESYSHGLYGLSFDVDGTIEACKMLLDGPDVYDILSRAVDESIGNLWDHLVLYTEGWAAPYSNQDIPPSQHPEKVRVHLVCFVHKDEKKLIESLISFEGENKLEYNSEGKGNLAKALLLIYSKNKNENTNTKQFYI